MRRSVTSSAARAAAALLPLAIVGVGWAPAQAAEPVVQTGAPQALYEMNEPSGATVMKDSGPYNLDGSIDQDGLNTGFTFGGATGYSFSCRECARVAPERVVRVQDNEHLDPRADRFTVEVRYRTPTDYGNIVQKGQGATRGGQWKIQNPGGHPSCLFRDVNGNRVATKSTVALNDKLWHTVTCVRTTSAVELYVDGVFNNRQRGTTGVVDNAVPLAIGGKHTCDDVTTSCDYYSGQIDYLRITRGS